MVKIAISCVVDDTPRLMMQCLNWLCSLHLLGTPSRADIFVHYVDSISSDRLTVFQNLGARLVPIKPFGSGPAAYCNKTRQLDTEELRCADYVILSDADIVFLTCPTAHAKGSEIRGKLVDLPNPPEAIWRSLAQSAGFTNPKVQEIELSPGSLTFATNFNGGLYVIPQWQAERLRHLWPKWASFCLNQPEILGRYIHHSDQIGFGFAAQEIEASIRYLNIQDNFPIHLKSFLQSVEARPLRAIHYHSEFDEDGLLKLPGIDWIDEQIATLNQNLSDFRSQVFVHDT